MNYLKIAIPAGIAAVAAAAVLVMGSCGKKTTTEVTNAAAATTAAPTTAAPTTAAPTPETTAPPSTKEVAQNKNIKIKTTIEKYVSKDVSIEYPQVSGLEDTAQQDKLNAHLKENALSILTSYPDSKEPMDPEKDTLDVECEVISADMSRVTAVYTGSYYMEQAAHPNNLFYTNTVDTKTLKDYRLSDAADPYTMAVFALAEDVVLKDADNELREAYLEWQKDMKPEQYQTCLENADFPLSRGSDGKTITWPDSFSYESEGDLYFSVPVPHALGDYVIVEYDVTTK